MEENKNKLNEEQPEDIKTECVEKKKEKKKTPEKKTSKNVKKNGKISTATLLCIIAVCLSVIGLTLATISLVITLDKGDTNEYGLQFYPDGLGNYIVGVGDGKYLSEIVIPETYNGKKVVAIADNGFENCTNLKAIVIPESVKSIGNYAFSECSSLTKVTMNNGVTSMGMYAFSDCTSLASIKLSENLENIGDYAFYRCSSLVSVSISDSVVDIGTNAFGECEVLSYNEYDNAYYLGNQNNPYHTLMKAKNTDITSCTINPNTKVVYYQAFYYCTAIEDITLPSEVVSIGAEAFMYCRNLKEVVLHDKIYSIY